MLHPPHRGQPWSTGALILQNSQLPSALTLCPLPGSALWTGTSPLRLQQHTDHRQARYEAGAYSCGKLCPPFPQNGKRSWRTLQPATGEPSVLGLGTSFLCCRSELGHAAVRFPCKPKLNALYVQDRIKHTQRLAGCDLLPGVRKLPKRVRAAGLELWILPSNTKPGAETLQRRQLTDSTGTWSQCPWS